MAFINDYLTNEEKDVFKLRAIPTGVFWKGGILGYDPYSKVKCTIDRDEHIYLFDLGRHHDAHESDDYHFALVWDSLFENEVVLYSLKGKYLYEPIPGNGVGMYWHSLELGCTKKMESKKTIVINKFKEALISFGLDGDSNLKANLNIKFDF